MKANVWIVLCCLFLAAGCGDGAEKSSLFRFESEVALTADSIRIDEMFTPAEWVIVGDLLIIRSDDEHPLFYTYSLPELEFVESFGFKGRGPDEYIAPHIVRDGSGEVYLYDNGNRKLQTLRLSKGNHAVAVDVGVLGGSELFSGLGHIDGDRFYGVVETPEEIRLKLYAIAPEGMRELSSLQMAASAEGRSGDYAFSTANDGQTVVTADWNQKRVVFWRVDDDAMSDKGNRTLEGLRSVKTVAEGAHDAGTIHYMQLYCNGDDFYALHLGASEDEAMTATSCVEVFDANGNGITRLQLDRLVTAIVADDAGRNLYALSAFNGDHIFKYELP